MVSREIIEKVIAGQEKIYNRNFQNYQSSGERRYERAYENAEDLMDIYRLALNAVDEHEKYLHLKGNVSQLGAEAVRVLHDESVEPEPAKRILRNLVAISEVNNPWR